MKALGIIFVACIVCSLTSEPDPSTREVYNYMTSKGLRPNQALGMLANGDRESNWNIDANNGSCYGVFQWCGVRRAAMVKAVPDWRDNWKGQIDFALTEKYGILYKEATFDSPKQAAEWFMVNFERPANRDACNRKNNRFLSTYTF